VSTQFVSVPVKELCQPLQLRTTH